MLEITTFLVFFFIGYFIGGLLFRKYEHLREHMKAVKHSKRGKL